MAQYRTTTKSASGEREYAKLVGDIWEPITEDEAKQAGVWRDPRGGQYGVKDELATTEQLAARDKGRYDVRNASGPHIAKRVRAVCAECGNLLTEFHDYEKRPLSHDTQSGAWKRDLGASKCRQCFEPLAIVLIDQEAVLDALERARESGKVQTVRVGLEVDALVYDADGVLEKRATMAHATRRTATKSEKVVPAEHPKTPEG